MHFHPIQEEPGHKPAYCIDHAPLDEPLAECWSELCVCVVCEEEDDKKKT